MREITPEYDGCWFAHLSDRQVVEAPTLAELKRKLGPGYAIVGYYPDGYDRRKVIVEESAVAADDVKERIQQIRVATAEDQPPPVVEVPVRVEAPVSLESSTSDRYVPRANYRRHDHDKILDLWSMGRTGPEIGRILGMPNWQRVGDIIARARRRGDPRAHERNKRKSL